MGDHKNPGKAPAPRRQAVGKRAARPRRLLRLVSAYLSDAGLDTPSEADRSLARAAAGSTLQLEDLDDALGRGETVDSLAYSRLAGVARRNLRSLGLVEGRSSPSGNGAAPRAGGSSTQKKVAPLWPWEEIPDENDVQCAWRAQKRKHMLANTDDGKRKGLVDPGDPGEYPWSPEGYWSMAHATVSAGPEVVAAVRASCAVVMAKATPVVCELLGQRLSDLDAEVEARAREEPTSPPVPNDEISRKKSFAARGNRPRRDE